MSARLIDSNTRINVADSHDLEKEIFGKENKAEIEELEWNTQSERKTGVQKYGQRGKETVRDRDRQTAAGRGWPTRDSSQLDYTVTGFVNFTNSTLILGRETLMAGAGVGEAEEEEEGRGLWRERKRERKEGGNE